MRCPRCETHSLKERHRNEVIIDVCAQCRGVWLDHGELEELITRAHQGIDDYESFYRKFERSYKPSRRHAAADAQEEGSIPLRSRGI